jgi:hypothetical protein
MFQIFSSMTKQMLAGWTIIHFNLAPIGSFQCNIFQTNTYVSISASDFHISHINPKFGAEIALPLMIQMRSKIPTRKQLHIHFFKRKMIEVTVSQPFSISKKVIIPWNT